MDNKIDYKNAINNYYLCGIGQRGLIKSFEVGKGTNRDSFKFNNGSYSPMELFLEPVGGDATYVIVAVPLSDIDDTEVINNKL